MRGYKSHHTVVGTVAFVATVPTGTGERTVPDCVPPPVAVVTTHRLALIIVQKKVEVWNMV